MTSLMDIDGVGVDDVDENHVDNVCNVVTLDENSVDDADT